METAVMMRISTISKCPLMVEKMECQIMVCTFKSYLKMDRRLNCALFVERISVMLVVPLNMLKTFISQALSRIHAGFVTRILQRRTLCINIFQSFIKVKNLSMAFKSLDDNF